MSPSATSPESISAEQQQHQPRHIPSIHCRLPHKPDLTPAQTSALEHLRTQVRAEAGISQKLKNWTSDDCLIRYLKARKWSVADAKSAILDTMRWRETYEPARPDREALWTETSAGKLYVSGFDAESRPLIYMKPRLENTAASPAQIRHVCFHLETAIALMPPTVENLAIIIDFSGSSMRTNPGVAVAREIIHVLGSHYPERLGKAYILH
ncbi:hypothetical protein BGZ94_000548, partial [Podila epigama]